jgi:hypothetical protein
MKFHLPSYALGVATGVVVSRAPERLRPVMIELAAVATTFSKIARAVVERQREWIEDLWAEVEERLDERFHATRSGNEKSAKDSASVTP